MTPIRNLIVLALMAVAFGCSDSKTSQDGDGQSDEALSVTLALNWYAEAEHGGFIAAKELGYYEDAGLDVNIEPGGVGAPAQVIQSLAAGRILFAISNADLVVLARARGVHLVAVAAPLQHSPRCIMVHKASGIDSLDKLADLELAISDTRPFALWMKKKLPLKNVTMVPFSGSVGEFVLKPKFAQQGYVFSEPYVAAEKGADPAVLMVSDIGFDPYSSLLVTTEDVIESHPDLVRSFVQASVRGWESYLADSERTNKKINSDNSDMSLDALAFGVEAMRPLCDSGDSRSCGMTLERWATLVSQIEELGEIDPDVVDPAKCFSTKFLPSPQTP